ncbi:MAG: PKD domain-containing protein, partial [Planctomycetota bacterium]
MAPDGTLLVLEYGDKWNENSDGALSRLVYRRGNRPPVARATANPPAGKAGVVVKLDASPSSDADGDTLKYEWRDAAGAVIAGEGPSREVRPATTGAHPYTVTVTDAKGAIPPEKVVWRATYLPRGAGEAEASHPGLALMRASTCFGCHMAG